MSKHFEWFVHHSSAAAFQLSSQVQSFIQDEDRLTLPSVYLCRFRPTWVVPLFSLRISAEIVQVLPSWRLSPNCKPSALPTSPSDAILLRLNSPVKFTPSLSRSRCITFQCPLLMDKMAVPHTNNFSDTKVSTEVTLESFPWENLTKGLFISETIDTSSPFWPTFLRRDLATWQRELLWFFTRVLNVPLLTREPSQVAPATENGSTWGCTSINLSETDINIWGGTIGTSLAIWPTTWTTFTDPHSTSIFGSLMSKVTWPPPGLETVIKYLTTSEAGLKNATQTPMPFTSSSPKLAKR